MTGFQCCAGRFSEPPRCARSERQSPNVEHSGEQRPTDGAHNIIHAGNSSGMSISPYGLGAVGLMVAIFSPASGKAGVGGCPSAHAVTGLCTVQGPQDH